MRERNLGSLKYYEVRRGKEVMLSVGKLHGDEPSSKYGILRALKIIDDYAGSVSYVVIPEVNSSKNRKYDGINLNRDFDMLSSRKTRDLSRIIETYRPKLIVDHHDNLGEAEGFIALISNPNPYESLERRLAEKLVEHVCTDKGMMKACTDAIKTYSGSDSIPTLGHGIYHLDMEDTLTGRYGGIVVEVDANLSDRKTVIEIHEECDLFLKSELERLSGAGGV